MWAANGSNEVIQQLLQAFGGPGRTALGFEPSYSMHPTISRTTSTRWVAAARDDDFGLDPDRAAGCVRAESPDLVFLTSPNNPTGTALPLPVIEAVCAAAPGMVVVDEAYAEFARDRAATALGLLPRYPRLVVVRTMSKAFALAGARVGYLAADPAVVDALLIVALPYHLSALTQAVARVALAHADELLAGVAALRSERDRLVAWLRAPRPGGRGLGRQLRAVRHVRRPARGLAGPARSRGARPRDRAGRLAAGQHRDRRGDGRLPRCARRRAGLASEHPASRAEPDGGAR